MSLGYQFGISGMWLVLMLSLGLLALALLFTTRLSKLGVYTVAEVLDLRYGDSARLISAVVMFSYALMLAVTQTIAVGTLFDVTLGIPRTWAILVAGGVVVLYSVAGGDVVYYPHRLPAVLRDDRRGLSRAVANHLDSGGRTLGTPGGLADLVPQLDLHWVGLPSSPTFSCSFSAS